MSLLVRKIEYAKWMQRDILGGEHPSADAITRCMKTTNNTLSVWSINNSMELEEAVLAIASEFDRPDAIDVLIIETSYLEDKGLELENNAGNTPYKDYVDKHKDIIKLDYSSLGELAQVIIESIRRLYNVRITKGELKKILINGINEGKIHRDDLKESLQNKLFPPAIQ